MIYDIKISKFDDEIQITKHKFMYGRREEEEKLDDTDNKNDTKNYKQPFVHTPYFAQYYIKDTLSKKINFPYCEGKDFDGNDIIIDLRNPHRNDERFKNMSAQNQYRSLKRSKQTIYDICRSNKWDYFVTLTISPDYMSQRGLNRDSYTDCRKVISVFLNHFKERKSNIEYLAVPETHKKGGYHFHCLVQGDLEQYLDINKFGRFTLRPYKIGFSDVSRADDSDRLSNYITKYITKDLSETLKNKRRFFCSRGLKRPEVHYINLRDSGLNLQELLQNCFPDYDVTYMKTYDNSFNPTSYIQLKKI